MGSVMSSLMGSLMSSFTGSLMNGAISLINAFIIEKHMVKDDILFTNRFSTKGKMSQHM